MKLLRDLEVFDKDLRALEAVEFKDGNLPEECHLFHKVYHLYDGIYDLPSLILQVKSDGSPLGLSLYEREWSFV